MRFALSFFFLFAILLLLPAHANAALSGVVISEIAWMGTEGSVDEWIELYNAESDSVDLSGWTLEAEDGSPSIELSGELNNGAFLVVYRGAELDYTGALKNSGETLVLRDDTGTSIASVSWSDGSPGDNETKQTMEITLNGSWVTSTDSGGTPGAENSAWTEVVPPTELPEETTPPVPSEVEETPVPANDPEPTPPPEDSNQEEDGTDKDTSADYGDEQAPIIAVSKEGGATPQEESGGVIISEILPNPEGKDAEAEFIELFNAGTFEISLDGWSLRDASGKQLSLSGTISPGEYLPLFSRDTSLPSLNNTGDVIELLDSNSTRRDGVSYGETKEGLALGRDTDGTWRWTTLPTPGSENNILAASASQDTSSVAVAPSAPEDKTRPPTSAPSESDALTNGSLDNSPLSAELGLIGSSAEKPRGDWSLFFGFLFSIAAGFAMFFLRLLRRSPKPSVEFAVEETENTN